MRPKFYYVDPPLKASVKSHSTSDKIYSYTIINWFSFIDNATNYFVKQSFIWQSSKSYLSPLMYVWTHRIP